MVRTDALIQTDEKIERVVKRPEELEIGGKTHNNEGKKSIQR